jgi:CIC family chloride channel protein
VIGGLAATFYVRLMLWLKKRFDVWTSDTARITLPGLAGLFVGIVGLWLPQVQGPGYLTIDSALHDRFDWSSLLLLGFAKILVTSLCFAAGTPGGLFAPTLFAGAMIGGGIGALAGHYWPFPFPHATQSAFVLVGMGTFFAGVFRAPMTSIFMVFEVSASYQIILPVMIANTLGYLIARQSGRVHFFDQLAREEGVELPSVQEARETRGLRVEDAMSPPGTVLRPDATIGDTRSAFAAATTTCLIVRCAPRLFATVHRAELDALTETRSEAFLADAYQLPNAPHLYPDLPLDAALRKFSSHPALPVVRRDAPDDVIGLLTLEDVAKAFRIERRAKSTPDVLSAAR